MLGLFDNIKVPAPFFVKPPLPPMAPESVNVVALSTSTIPEPVRVIAFEEEISAVVLRVPPLKVREPVPKLSSADI